MTQPRIEIINEITGVGFNEAFSRKAYLELEGKLRIPVISMEDLFKYKDSTGRIKDEADLEELRKFIG